MMHLLQLQEIQKEKCCNILSYYNLQPPSTLCQQSSFHKSLQSFYMS